MIAQLKGQIVASDLTYLVLDVMGVGYQIFASGRSLSQLGGVGAEVTVLTELVVREDSMTLYGFASEGERAAFRLLQTVQGVGAKAALSILTVLTPDELAQAILAGDKAMVARAEGIGPKLALRIVNELAQKTASLAGGGLQAASDGVASPDATTAAQNAVLQDALSALVNLGYSRTEAFTALQNVQKQGTDNDISALIAAALKQMGSAQ
ncbi:MAG: Holliday junction ATP-dependent DNA helicase RuvA [Rhodospirillaceae bacterium]|jgi:Holliday junction DNA helicase RuvA|nr:Holliday junction branch migration protein RuvA [Alphaproteobacteria bacterium]CAI8277752.1 MAG: Holliday junction ATP-dependent DNA helicase RuvA [Rhodospirillaceae bacterium]